MGTFYTEAASEGKRAGWHSRDAAANNAPLWLQGDFNLPQNRM